MNRKKFLQTVTTATAATALTTPTVKGSSDLSYEALPARGRDAFDAFLTEVNKVSEVSGASAKIIHQITSPKRGFTFASRPGGFTVSFDCLSGQTVRLNHQKGKLRTHFN